MEGFWVQILVILAFLCENSGASDTTEVIGAVGRSVTFRIPNTEGEAAFWIFGNKPLVTVKFGDPPQVLFPKDEFKTRFDVSEEGRALSISQLSLEDAGSYSVTIKGQTFTFTLLVYGELAEPTVTCEARNCSGGSCSFSLRCSAPGAGLGNVSYAWSVGARPGGAGPRVLLLGDGGDPRGQGEPLTCTATNAVSSRNVTVPAPAELCQENSTHPPGPGALPGSGSRVGIVAGVAAALLLLVFLVFLCKSKGWTKFRLSKSQPSDTAGTTEFVTVYAEVGPSQQRIANGIKPKPAGGESSTTIYSLVKRPEQGAEGTAENANATGLELV